MEKYCTAGQATGEKILRRMRFACWITKATDTNSEYITLIVFPLQQWLSESAAPLRHTYIACLVQYTLTYANEIQVVFSLQFFSPNSFIFLIFPAHAAETSHLIHLEK